MVIFFRSVSPELWNVDRMQHVSSSAEHSHNVLKYLSKHFIVTMQRALYYMDSAKGGYQRGLAVLLISAYRTHANSFCSWCYAKYTFMMFPNSKYHLSVSGLLRN